MRWCKSFFLHYLSGNKIHSYFTQSSVTKPSESGKSVVDFWGFPNKSASHVSAKISSPKSFLVRLKIPENVTSQLGNFKPGHSSTFDLWTQASSFRSSLLSRWSTLETFFLSELEALLTKAAIENWQATMIRGDPAKFGIWHSNLELQHVLASADSHTRI